MTTQVVNLRTEAYDVYIGRAGRGEDGFFGNPIRVGRVCTRCGEYHKTAGSTLSCFAGYFIERVSSDAYFCGRVLQLHGKRLGCFCKPGPCHGDVIKHWLDRMERAGYPFAGRQA